MNNNEKKNTNYVNYIVYVILIIIIALLGLKTCSLMNNKEEPIKTPTGNVDVFEIQCDKKTCVVETKDNDETPKDIPVDKPTSESPKEVDIEIDEGSVDVVDKYTTWKSTNNLRIFTNAKYDNNSIIAPEDSNAYEFKVYNNTIYKIKYSIIFDEINDYGINLKYKLKRGNQYLAGDEDTWVSYNELNISNKSLDISDSDTYTLEWKWVSSDNDALVGGNLNNKYQLDIQLDAESVE